MPETPIVLGERGDLIGMLKPDCDWSFSVVRAVVEEGASVTIDAAVQLDWHPGLRRRPFHGTGSDGDEAYAEVLANAKTCFAGVWQMPDGTGCFA